jgi:N-acetylneuraminic acid mutarotase
MTVPSPSGADFSVVEAYDPVSDTWSTKAPMPTPRHDLGVGVINGVLFAVGGSSFSCNCQLSTVEAYDPVSDTWSTKAPMPTVRDSPAVGVVNGILYAVGGDVSGTWLSTVEAYDPVSDTWSTKAAMPTARSYPAAGVVDGILYAVGGSNPFGSPPLGSLPTLEVYDPVSNTWSTKAPMPTPRWYLAAGAVNEILYAVGGYQDLSTVEAYDPASDNWTRVAPMPTGRGGLKVGVVNGGLYAVGGYDYTAGHALSTNEAFTPSSPNVALLSGGNTFTGNQTVTGSVNATAFKGDGSALTSVTSTGLNCLACVSSQQLGINYAGSTSQGGPAISALNASALGGLLPSAFQPAGSYATTNGNNLFSGNQSIAGNLTIGTGGTPIFEYVSVTDSISVPALTPGTCTTFTTAAVTGLTPGTNDTIALGTPSSLVSGLGAGIFLMYQAWETTTTTSPTITIQVCNPTATKYKGGAIGTVRIDIFKH